MKEGRSDSTLPSFLLSPSACKESGTHSSTTGSLVDHREKLLFERSSKVGSRLRHLDDASREDLEEETRVGLFLGL